MVASAQVAPGPIAFRAGYALKADEVNHDFAWLAGHIDGVQNEVTTLATAVDAIENSDAIVGPVSPQRPEGSQGPQGPQAEV